MAIPAGWTSLWVFLGAGLGANFRYWIGLWAVRHLEIPALATLGINVSGSALMGAVLAWSVKGGLSPGWCVFLMTGLLGGFTTFSAFSVEAIDLFHSRSLAMALGYVGASVVASILGCGAGMALGKAL